MGFRGLAPDGERQQRRGHRDDRQSDEMGGVSSLEVGKDHEEGRGPERDRRGRSVCSRVAI